MRIVKSSILTVIGRIIDCKVNIICGQTIGKCEVFTIDQHGPAADEQAMGEKSRLIHLTQEVRNRLQERAFFKNYLQ